MSTKICPTCNQPIPANSPGGFCPSCLLREAEELPPAPGHEPPTLEDVAAAFPKLELIRLLGRGGMGFVYEARQPDLDRTVALKILSPRLGSDPAFAERFAREARILGSLQHPNIVTLFEHGQQGGFYYLLMEHVDGVNLRQAMQAGRFTPEQALAVVPDICDALQTAHSQGIWHRDIKPENILLDKEGRVKIADFGIARILGDPSRNFTLTQTGNALGSSAYMAPEQLEDPRHVDHRADIYSLGVVLYEMLTGELPLGRFPNPSQRAAVDSRIDHVVLRTLEKERELRPQSATQVKTEVEGAGKTPPPQPSQPKRLSSRKGVLIGCSVALLVALVALFIPLILISLFRSLSANTQAEAKETEVKAILHQSAPFNRIMVEFSHPDDMGGHRIQIPVIETTGWLPTTGQPIGLRNGATVWVKCRLSHSDPHAVELQVASSSDEKRWETRMFTLPRNWNQTKHRFSNGTEVTVGFDRSLAPSDTIFPSESDDNYTTPERAITSHIRAAKEGDLAVFECGLSTRLIDLISRGNLDNKRAMDGWKNLKYVDQIHADDKTARARLKLNDEQRNFEAYLVQWNGNWQVDSLLPVGVNEIPMAAPRRLIESAQNNDRFTFLNHLSHELIRQLHGIEVGTLDEEHLTLLMTFIANCQPTIGGTQGTQEQAWYPIQAPGMGEGETSLELLKENGEWKITGKARGFPISEAALAMWRILWAARQDNLELFQEGLAKDILDEVEPEHLHASRMQFKNVLIIAEKNVGKERAEMILKEDNGSDQRVTFVMVNEGGKWKLSKEGH